MSRASRDRVRAFTLIELLGVMAIIIILVAISVPAFSAMLRSSRATLADGNLRAALISARDASIQSIDGGDTAAVFLFQPGGALSIGVYQEVGRHTPAVDGMPRSVFVADPAFEVQQLPSRWLVRGLTPAETIQSTNDTTEYGWYSTQRYPRSEVNWVFPETNFFDPTQADNQGTKRQTFMVRFRAGTGELAIGEQGQAIVYDPSVDMRRTGAPFNVPRFNPIREPNHRRVVRSILTDPTLSAQNRERLIGDRSTDTILARSIGQVALYDVRELSRVVRADGIAGFTGVDPVTGCLYEDVSRRADPAPIINPAVSRAVARHLPEVGELFNVDRYTGNAQRIGVPFP